MTVISPSPAFKIPGCLPENVTVGATTWTYWVPAAVFELTLVVLGVAKFVQAAGSGNRQPRIMSILLRDSIVYFGGMWSTILCCLCVWMSARVSPIITVAPAFDVLICRNITGNALRRGDGVGHTAEGNGVYD